jgi:hypothetical protein
MGCARVRVAPKVSQRDGGDDGGAGGRGKKLNSAAQPIDAFVHSAQADAQCAQGILGRLQKVSRNSLAVVLDFQFYRFGLATNANISSLAAGMAVDIRQALLKDTKNGEFHVAGHALASRSQYSKARVSPRKATM